MFLRSYPSPYYVLQWLLARLLHSRHGPSKVCFFSSLLLEALKLTTKGSFTRARPPPLSTPNAKRPVIGRKEERYERYTNCVIQISWRERNKKGKTNLLCLLCSLETCSFALHKSDARIDKLIDWFWFAASWMMMMMMKGDDLVSLPYSRRRERRSCCCCWLLFVRTEEWWNQLNPYQVN